MYQWSDLVKCINSDFCKYKSCSHFRWHPIVKETYGRVNCTQEFFIGHKMRGIECDSDCICSPKETYYLDAEERRERIRITNKGW